MTGAKLLVVEDDEGLSRQYRWALSEYQLLFASTRQKAAVLAAREHPPVALIDLGLPPDPDGSSEGLALLQEILALVPDAKVVVATGREELDDALRAIALGAFDFYRKPVDVEVLRIILARAFNLAHLEEENRRLQGRALPSPISRIITGDDGMLRLCRSIEKLATTDVTVLILGESGTGKEALAHALHELGPRSDKPFIPINCAAIPETLLESELFGHERGAFTGAVRQTIGKFESANRGTLFLDEIGDLPLSLQVKLLRFLQDQVIERIGSRQPIRVDARIVCATNADLEAKMARGEFREDLFYRLNEVTMRVPPLRERLGDPVLLANFFLNNFAAEFRRRVKGFSATAMTAIATHNWPGNVRELENRIKRAVVMSERAVIEPADLELAPPPDQSDLDLRVARTRVERQMVQLALARSNGTIATAAKLLGISRPTLYALMETHAISGVADPPSAETEPAS
jgi:two-component system NtrC family response regulator